MLAWWRIALSFVLVGSLATSHALGAQSLLVGPMAKPEAAAPAPTPATSETRAQNAEHLQVALRKLEANGSSDSAAAHDVAYYQAREAVLTQQEGIEQQSKDFQARNAELESQLKWPAVGENPSTYNFAELDQVKDELAAEEARLNLVGDKFAATKSGVEKARLALDEAVV